MFHLDCSSGGRWKESNHSIIKMGLFDLPIRLNVRFNSLGLVKLGHLPNSLRPGLGNNELALMGVQV